MYVLEWRLASGFARGMVARLGSSSWCSVCFLFCGNKFVSPLSFIQRESLLWALFAQKIWTISTWSLWSSQSAKSSIVITQSRKKREKVFWKVTNVGIKKKEIYYFSSSSSSSAALAFPTKTFFCRQTSWFDIPHVAAYKYWRRSA